MLIGLKKTDAYCRAVMQTTEENSQEENFRIRFKINKTWILTNIGRLIVSPKMIPRSLDVNHDHILAGQLEIEKNTSQTWETIRIAAHALYSVTERVKSCLKCI